MSNTLETVHAEWVRERVFILRDRNNFPIVMTQPNGVSGADLLPMSLMGCTMWDTIAILEKKRQKVMGFRATASSVRDAEPPWVFREIHIRDSLTGRSLDPKQVQSAIEISEQKYCSIYATLKQVVRITSDFEIAEE